MEIHCIDWVEDLNWITPYSSTTFPTNLVLGDSKCSMDAKTMMVGTGVPS
jgi:hypothetical protein